MSRKNLLHDRSIVALLAAEVISTTGSQMTWIALPWFVLVTSGSATKTTFVAAAEVIGLALLGLPGGRVLGRLGARRTMILCDSVRAPLMLVIDAASYLVSVVLVTVFVPARPPVAQEPEHRSIRAGIRFLANDPLLRVWWPAFAVGDAAWTAFFISVPVLVLTRFGHHPLIAGLLIASFGVGALIGNMIAFRYLARRFDGLAITAMFVMGQALPLWLLWLDLPAAGYSAAILLSGIANGLVNPSLHTVSTLRVPPQLRPTVLTTTMVGWAVVNPMGLFIAGPVLDAFGTRPVLIGFAAVQTVTMAIVATAALRELARRRELEPLEAAA